MSVTSHTSLIRIGGFKPTGNPLTSHFGLTPLALPDEKWPTFIGKLSNRAAFFGDKRLSGNSEKEEKNYLTLNVVFCTQPQTTRQLPLFIALENRFRRGYLHLL
jgi:hypothetical protein